MGIAVEEFMEMEVKMLGLIEYELYVSETEYLKYV